MGSKEEVLALEERLRQGDAGSEPDTSAVFDELLDDEILFVRAEGNHRGKTAVLTGHRPPRKRSVSKVENSGLELIEVGSTVVVSCRTEYEVGTRSFAFRAVRVWNRTGAFGKSAQHVGWRFQSLPRAPEFRKGSMPPLGRPLLSRGPSENPV